MGAARRLQLRSVHIPQGCSLRPHLLVFIAGRYGSELFSRASRGSVSSLGLAVFLAGWHTLRRGRSRRLPLLMIRCPPSSSISAFPLPILRMSIGRSRDFGEASVPGCSCAEVALRSILLPIRALRLRDGSRVADSFPRCVAGSRGARRFHRLRVRSALRHRASPPCPIAPSLRRPTVSPGTRQASTWITRRQKRAVFHSFSVGASSVARRGPPGTLLCSEVASARSRDSFVGRPSTRSGQAPTPLRQAFGGRAARDCAAELAWVCGVYAHWPARRSVHLRAIRCPPHPLRWNDGRGSRHTALDDDVLAQLGARRSSIDGYIAADAPPVAPTRRLREPASGANHHSRRRMPAW